MRSNKYRYRYGILYMAWVFLGAAAAFQSHVGFFGYLNFASSSILNVSSAKLHQRRLLIHRPGKKHHFNSSSSVELDGIRLLAAISEQEAQSQQQHIDTRTPTSSSSSTLTKGWSEFAEKVSGEWDGYGANFSKEGEPIELPESVIPEAYREWEVKVFDWQTQCPTLALPTHHFQLSYKLIRLLPTVGCEADTATRYSIIQRNILNDNIANNNYRGDAAAAAAAAAWAALAFAYQSNGCYVAVWPAETAAAAKGAGQMNGSRLLELEHCLTDPRDRESRVRIIQEVRVQQLQQDHEQHEKQLTMMQLEGIKVFREQWYGPFRNGEQLGGCAIRDSAFASTPTLQSSKISGVWHRVLHATASFQHDYCRKEDIINIRELVAVADDDDSVPKSCSRDGTSLILLPKQLWSCSWNPQQEHGETCFQVGWLLEVGFAINSKCSFTAEGNLKEIAITCETTDSMMLKPHNTS